MFDIGFAELVFLAVLGLLVLGPKRLPEVAAQLGRWVGQARRMSRTLMYQLRQEVNLDDPKPFSSRKSSAPGGSGAGSTQNNTAGSKDDTRKDKPETSDVNTEQGKSSAEQGKSSE